MGGGLTSAERKTTKQTDSTVGRTILRPGYWASSVSLTLTFGKVSFLAADWGAFSTGMLSRSEDCFSSVSLLVVI